MQFLVDPAELEWNLALAEVKDDASSTDVNEETAYQEMEIPASHLVDGTNVLAPEVHQVALDDAGRGFDLALTAQREEPVYSTPIDPRANGLRYSDAGDELPATWRDTDYSEPGWQCRRAQFGFGDGDEATALSSGPGPQAKNPVTHVRKVFNVANPRASPISTSPCSGTTARWSVSTARRS